MRTILLVLFAAVPTASLSGQQGMKPVNEWRDLDLSLKGATPLRPKDGFVPDEATAIRIAEAVAIAQWGEKQISTERPFKARLRGAIWTIKGTLTKLVPGGTAVVQLNKMTGAVVFAVHQQ